jgi:translocation and assembly module TamA
MIDVQPGKRHHYEAGIGYGTDTGARGSLGYSNRRINRRGHRFRSMYRFSQIRNSLEASYAIPLKKPLTDQLEYSASLISEHPTKEREEDIYTVGISHTVSPRPNWIRTLYFKYIRDSYRIGSFRDATWFFLPGGSIERIYGRVEDTLQTGNRISLELRGSHEMLALDTAFFQPMLTAKLIQRITPRGRVILRSEVAGTVIDDFNELPPILRYYAGGDNSVRGYAYQDLSPVNASGERIGGKQKLVGSLEYDFRFKQRWSAAVFFDTGNAFNQWSKTNLKDGTGFGLRWHSPVGPLRFDIAWPISEPDPDPRIHVVFGPEL